MNHKLLKLVFVLLCLGLTGLQAQESINTAGGNVTGTGGSASYTLGQMVYATNSGKDGTIFQGIQQPYKILTVTEIEKAKLIKLSIKAYPNPTTDFLTLSIEEFDMSNLSYQLYDIQGRLLQRKKLTKTKTQINMSNYVSSYYFVKIIQSDKEVKTFKIIKNQHIAQ